MKCIRTECIREAKARGYCYSHYVTARRRGDIKTQPRIKHGLWASPEYRVWDAMKQRCLNPKNRAYHNYGGRGIKVCERWLKFENFIADIGKRPSPKHELDRINNNDGYCIENCRWADHTMNMHNRRTFSMTGAKGVNKNGTGYSSEIQKYGIKRYLGTYKTVEEASAAYKKAAQSLYND